MTSWGVLVLVATLAVAPAEASVPTDPPRATPGFRCFGEARSVMEGLRTREIRAERDKRLHQLDQGRVPARRLAHHHCVLAELMRRLGDHRAAAHYERAIKLDPDEPAYELWYARYLQWSRGASGPLTEAAERHDYRALARLESHDTIGQSGSLAEVARQWARKNLLGLYQADGLPLLADSKAFDSPRDATRIPQVFFGATTSINRDTNDLWELSDTRRFTSERQLAQSRSSDPLTRGEIRSIVRAPLRYEFSPRLRLRDTRLGALDLGYRFARMHRAILSDFGNPTARNDITLDELGASWHRTFAAYPVADLRAQLGYLRQRRVGAVEQLPDRVEGVDVVHGALMASRYLGPDKLTLGWTQVYFAIPELTEGPLDQRQRQRTIGVGFLDFAIYRPLRLPQLQHGTFARRRTSTRGWHLLTIARLDDERFGATVIRRRNLGGGTTFKGGQGLDITAMALALSNRTEVFGRPRDDLSSSQLRAQLRLVARLIDPELDPGLPRSPLDMLLLVIPARHDAATTGPNDYANVRAGLELWGRLPLRKLRGATLLLTTGAQWQYFYPVDRQLWLARLDVRLGWSHLGIIPGLS